MENENNKEKKEEKERKEDYNKSSPNPEEIRKIINDPKKAHEEKKKYTEDE